MKILLISPERTRSSILYEFLIKKYCLIDWLTNDDISPLNPSIKDNYIKLISHNKIGKELEARDWQKDIFKETPDFFFKSHKEYFNNMINNQFSFVVKMHISDIIAEKYSGEVININDINLDKFDHIYISQRNDISEFVSSYYIAEKEKIWQIYQNSHIKEIKEQIIPLNDIDRILRYRVWNDLVINHIKFHLEEKNISYQILEYLEIPNWIEKNTTNKIQKLLEDIRIKPFKDLSKIESNIVYNQKITNYDDIINRYNEIKNNLIDLFYAQNPKLQRIK